MPPELILRDVTLQATYDNVLKFIFSCFTEKILICVHIRRKSSTYFKDTNDVCAIHEYVTTFNFVVVNLTSYVNLTFTAFLRIFIWSKPRKYRAICLSRS